MARARVYEPHQITTTGNGFTEKRRVLFFGSDIAEDISEFDVTFLETDSLATARTKIIAAARADGQRFGYTVGVVVFPELARSP